MAIFQGCQGSCGIVPNGLTGSLVSFNIHQDLKYWHITSTPILTMLLLCSHPWSQGLNMFLLQQVFHSECDKESLVLLCAKSSLQQKLIKVLEMRVLLHKVSLLPHLSKNKFWQLELASWKGVHTGSILEHQSYVNRYGGLRLQF